MKRLFSCFFAIYSLVSLCMPLFSADSPTPSMIITSPEDRSEDFVIDKHYQFLSGKNLEQKVPSVNESALTLEGGPSAVVAGCVNAITGDYFESCVDLVSPGTHPLVVQRTYCSAQRKWHHLHMPKLEVAKSGGKHHLNAVYMDDNGSGIPYRAHLRKNEPTHSLKVTKSSYEKLSNAAAGDVSGRTNWSNSRMEFIRENKKKLYKIVFGSGIERSFACYKDRGERHQSGVNEGKFQLIRERNPNGNSLFFHYRDPNELFAVEAKNSTGQLLGILKRITQRDKEFWSDGERTVSYIYKNDDLVSVIPSHGITTNYSYHTKKFQKNLPDNRFLQIKYELQFSRHMAFDLKKRVSSISAPVGVDSTPIQIFTFKYNPSSTDVRDFYGNLIQYTFDEDNKLLSSVGKFVNNQLYCLDQFYWHKQNRENFLMARVFQSNGHTLFVRTFDYDNFGNIIGESLWGNLTGRSTQPMILHGYIPQNAEVFTKTFLSSQDGLNLPLREDNGRSWKQSTYYPNTNLLATRFTGAKQKILKREFFAYDTNGTLMEEIWDDGVSTNKEDLSGMTERHRRKITPRVAAPIGLPEVIEEFYFDHTAKREMLLKKWINVHASSGKIIEQRHYGSDGNFAYTLFWKYDRLGNMTEEVNAIGEVIFREYDANGNKIREKIVPRRKNLTTTIPIVLFPKRNFGQMANILLYRIAMTV